VTSTPWNVSQRTSPPSEKRSCFANLLHPPPLPAKDPYPKEPSSIEKYVTRRRHLCGLSLSSMDLICPSNSSQRKVGMRVWRKLPERHSRACKTRIGMPERRSRLATQQIKIVGSIACLFHKNNQGNSERVLRKATSRGAARATPSRDEAVSEIESDLIFVIIK